MTFEDRTISSLEHQCSLFVLVRQPSALTFRLFENSCTKAVDQAELLTTSGEHGAAGIELTSAQGAIARTLRRRPAIPSFRRRWRNLAGNTLP